MLIKNLVRGMNLDGRFTAAMRLGSCSATNLATQNPETVYQLRPTRKVTAKKRNKSTAVISAEDNLSFKELKEKVVALRARELNVLAG